MLLASLFSLLFAVGVCFRWFAAVSCCWNCMWLVLPKVLISACLLLVCADLFYVQCISGFLLNSTAMFLIKVCPLGFPFAFVCVSLHSFTLWHRMFVVSYSPLHLFELVACHCRLSYHAYLREVGSDGSVLGGVELETAVAHEGAAPTHFLYIFLRFSHLS
jgi:hypothetical protein